MKNTLSYLLLIGMAVGLILLVRHGVRNAGNSIGGESAVGGGGPYTAAIAVGRRSDFAIFSLKVTDGSGRTCRTIKLPNGRNAPPPKLVVRDAEDQIVFTGRFAYG